MTKARMIYWQSQNDEATYQNCWPKPSPIINDKNLPVVMPVFYPTRLFVMMDGRVVVMIGGSQWGDTRLNNR